MQYLKECETVNEQKLDIRSANCDDILQLVAEVNEKPFRVQQIFNWIHGKGIESFDEMTNLSAALRQKLSDIAEFSSVKIVQKQISSDGTTRKYLFEMAGNDIMNKNTVYVESVLMTYNYGLSVCLSSQAGCRMGCTFCASGLNGLNRNLTAGEIAAQYYHISHDIGKRIGNIVLMGVGEPLDNYDNVLKFIGIINHKEGANVGQRHISLSTCGIVPRIYDLIKENLHITLDISLHAPNNQIRRSLMPIARTYDIDELLKACRAYEKAHRRISFEYIMIDGVNDTEACAKELAKRLCGMRSHVNLIPANKIPEKGYTKSNAKNINRFAEILKTSGFEVTKRRELGADISAACGQLRNEFISN